MPLIACDTGNLIAGAATLCYNGVFLGLTTGGTTIRQESEYVETIADQFNGVAAKYRSLERFYIATSLLEVTLERLRIALGYPSANLTSATSLTLGYNSSCYINEGELVVKGPGIGCGCRTFVFDRVTNVQTTVEYQMFRDQYTNLPVEFEALKACPEGTFGVVVDGCDFQNGLACDAPA